VTKKAGATAKASAVTKRVRTLIGSRGILSSDFPRAKPKMSARIPREPPVFPTARPKRGRRAGPPVFLQQAVANAQLPRGDRLKPRSAAVTKYHRSKTACVGQLRQAGGMCSPKKEAALIARRLRDKTSVHQLPHRNPSRSRWHRYRLIHRTMSTTRY